MLNPWKRFCSQIVYRWVANDHSTSAAAIAFYVIFSLAPIVVFSVAIAGQVLRSDESAQQAAIEFLNNNLGDNEDEHFGTQIVEQIKLTAFREASVLQTIGLCVIAVWSASATFMQLRTALNRINGFAAESIREGVISVVLGRIRATLFSIGVGLMLAIATLLSTWSHTLYVKFPLLGLGDTERTNWLPTQIISWLSVLAVFYCMLRFLPMKRPPWREVMSGAIFGTICFQIGKYILIPLAAQNVVATAYVNSGILVVTVMWIFLSTHVLLFAAEIGHMLFAPETSPFERFQKVPEA